MRRPAAGFTLLEVLASLALLALLLLGVYAGIRTATHSVSSGTAAVERIDQIRSTQQFLRRELAQAMAQPIERDGEGQPIYFAGDPRVMRYVAPLPGYLGRLGPQLQQLELVDDDNGGLRLQLSLAVLPPDGTPALALGEPQVLLDGIEQGEFSYSGLDMEGQPVPYTGTWADGRTLPQLARVQLRMRGITAWPLLEVPLRAEAPETGMRTGRMRRGLR